MALADVTHPQYTEYANRVNLVYDFMDEVRVTAADKVKTYLPVRSHMSDAEYEMFLSLTMFVSHTSIAHSALFSLITASTPEVTDIAPKLISGIITADGKNLKQLGEWVAYEQLVSGRVGLLVDTMDTGKPYIALYAGTTIQDWTYERVAGIEKLTAVTLLEIDQVRSEDAGYEERHIYRRLYLDNGVYRQRILHVTGTEFVGQVPDSDEVITPTVGGKTLSYIPFYIENWDISAPSITPTPPLHNTASLSKQHFLYSNVHSVSIIATQPTTWVFTKTSRDDLRNEISLTPMLINVLPEGSSVQVLEAAGNAVSHVDKKLERINDALSSTTGRLFSSDATVGSESPAVHLTKSRTELATVQIIHAAMERVMRDAVVELAYWRGGTKEKTATIVYSDVHLDRTLDPRMLEQFIELHYAGLFPIAALFNVFRSSNWLPTGLTLPEFRDMLTDREEFTQTMRSSNATDAALGIVPPPASPLKPQSKPSKTRANPKTPAPKPKPGTGKSNLRPKSKARARTKPKAKPRT